MRGKILEALKDLLEEGHWRSFKGLGLQLAVAPIRKIGRWFMFVVLRQHKGAILDPYKDVIRALGAL